MKVKYAAQLLSRSVSLSLKYCRENLKLEQFQGSEATEQFLLIINDIFDLMNSRSEFSNNWYWMKNALSERNKDVWKKVFSETSTYLRGLTTMNSKSLVSEDSRKTGFAGFLLNIEAFENIYNDLIVAGRLQYLCTYKFSQDYLEHFFGLIRIRFGYSNNPTPYQFKSMYKKILMGVTEKIVEGGNVIVQDHTEMVGVIPFAKDKIDYVCEMYDIDIDLNNLQQRKLSEYQESVSEYIGGYIISRISTQLTCCNCIDALKSEKHPGLIECRDISEKMTYPSEFVKKTCSCL